MPQNELRLDQLLRSARGVGLPDAISAQRAADLAGDLGPSVASFTRYSAVPKDKEWFDTEWGTRAIDSRIIDPRSVMGIHRALHISPRDIVLASATTAGLPGMWREPSEVSRARLWYGWDLTVDARFSVVRKVGIQQWEDQSREEENERLRARTTELERRVAELERAARRPRRA